MKEEGEGEERGEGSLFFEGGRKRGREGESVSLYASAEKAFAETDTLNNTDKLKMIEGYQFVFSRF